MLAKPVYLVVTLTRFIDRKIRMSVGNVRGAATSASGSRSAEPPAQRLGRAEGGRDWPRPNERGRIVGSNRTAAMHRFERAHGLAVSLVSLVRRSRFVLSRFSVIANRDGAVACSGFRKYARYRDPSPTPASSHRALA